MKGGFKASEFDQSVIHSFIHSFIHIRLMKMKFCLPELFVI